jgi:hypothetical protein
MRTLLVVAVLAVPFAAPGAPPTPIVEQRAAVQSEDATSRRAALWKSIRDSAYAPKTLPQFPPVFSMGALLDPVFLRTTMTHESDVMPAGRQKLIHTYGTVAQIRLVVDTDHPYTGLLKSGAIGLARASLALKTPGWSFTPGLAVKLFVDGAASQNFFVMDSLDGQGSDFNYFSKRFATVVQPPENPTLKLVAGAFDEAVASINMNGSSMALPLEHLSTIDAKGKLVKAPRFPARLVFVPVFKGFASDDVTDFRDQFTRIAPSTRLYDVFASETLAGDKDLVRIGHVITESAFVASQFGDEQLFFKHFMPSDHKDRANGQ